jgi:hypothetical protein
LHIITVKTRGTGDSCKYIIVTRKVKRRVSTIVIAAKKTLKNEKKPEEEYSKETQTSLRCS